MKSCPCQKNSMMMMKMMTKSRKLNGQMMIRISIYWMMDEISRRFVSLMLWHLTQYNLIGVISHNYNITSNRNCKRKCKTLFNAWINGIENQQRKIWNNQHATDKPLEIHQMISQLDTSLTTFPAQLFSGRMNQCLNEKKSSKNNIFSWIQTNKKY